MIPRSFLGNFLFILKVAIKIFIFLLLTSKRRYFLFIKYWLSYNEILWRVWHVLGVEAAAKLTMLRYEMMNFYLHHDSSSSTTINLINVTSNHIKRNQTENDTNQLKIIKNIKTIKKLKRLKNKQNLFLYFHRDFLSCILRFCWTKLLWNSNSLLNLSLFFCIKSSFTDNRFGRSFYLHWIFLV